ncbi:MAG: hypothetical protein PVJ33_05495 [Lysobacterales bacterium]|jgi:hypothetical protein
MKKALIVILVLLLVAGGGVWYFVSFRLDGLIQQRIEQAGTASLGNRVSVGSVKTNIRDGSLSISHITVANPPGFDNPNAFSLDNIEAAVDYGNLEVKRIVIDKPEIVIEEAGGETNFSKMLQELESTESSPPTGKPEPEIVIRHFRMNESRAAFESKSLGRYSDVKVDSIELNDIRGTPNEVARQIASKVLSQVASDAATEVLKAQARKKFGEVEDKVGSKLKDLLGGDEESTDSGDQKPDGG